MIRAELHTAFATAELVDLFNRYHRFMHVHRGWPLQEVTLESYYRDFVAGGVESGKQWLYFNEEKLVGVALMDEVPNAISLVYCFYDPAWRGQSPGTFSILNQLRYAKERGLRYAYFGYWVSGCQSLSYKSHFRPHEILRGLPEEHRQPVWVAARPDRCRDRRSVLRSFPGPVDDNRRTRAPIHTDPKAGRPTSLHSPPPC